METIKELFKQIEFRVTNPLIFSFALSWLAYNWELVILLAYFDDSMLKATGCNTLMEMVGDYLTRKMDYKAPLCVAILYTIFMPFVAAFIKTIQAFAFRLGESGSLKALGDVGLPFGKFTELRDSYTKKKTELDEIVREQSIDKKALNEANAKVSQLQNTVDDVNHEKQKTDNEFRIALIELDNIRKENQEYKTKIRTYISLNELMPSEWILESQRIEIGVGIQRLVESFYVEKDSMIFGKGKEYIVSDILTYESHYLSFKKQKIKSLEVIQVSLLQISYSYWLGVETKVNSGNKIKEITYIRCYRKNQKPASLPYWFNRIDLENSNYPYIDTNFVSSIETV